jgi:hypothetical protein
VLEQPIMLNNLKQHASNSRLRNPHVVRTAGLVFLIIANVSNYFLARITGFSKDLVDAGNGFLFGVAIALILLSMVATKRSASQRCA